MKIKFLDAYNGDSILLSFKEGAIHRNILIDGGMAAAAADKKSLHSNHHCSLLFPDPI